MLYNEGRLAFIMAELGHWWRAGQRVVWWRVPDDPPYRSGLIARIDRPFHY